MRVCRHGKVTMMMIPILAEITKERGNALMNISITDSTICTHFLHKVNTEREFKNQNGLVT